MFVGAKLLAFREGMGYYADQLAGRLDVTLGADVLEVRQADDDVTWREADGTEQTRSVAGAWSPCPHGWPPPSGQIPIPDARST
jgi:hypothetical protein